jgi:hypothetical protein
MESLMRDWECVASRIWQMRQSLSARIRTASFARSGPREDSAELEAKASRVAVELYIEASLQIEEKGEIMGEQGSYRRTCWLLAHKLTMLRTCCSAWEQQA